MDESRTNQDIYKYGMWETLSQSSPLGLLHLSFSKLHLKINREEREEGSPSSGKDWRLGQCQICNSLREVRCWSPLWSRDFRFERCLISRVVRLEGSSISSGKDSTSSHIAIVKLKREWSDCKSHCLRFLTSLQFVTLNAFNFKPLIGKEWSSGQLLRDNLTREGSEECMRSGKDSKFKHLCKSSSRKFEGGLEPPIQTGNLVPPYPSKRRIFKLTWGCNWSKTRSCSELLVSSSHNNSKLSRSALPFKSASEASWASTTFWRLRMQSSPHKCWSCPNSLMLDPLWFPKEKEVNVRSYASLPICGGISSSLVPVISRCRKLINLPMPAGNL